MKVKKWLKVTNIDDMSNLRVNKDFYNSQRDNEKDIQYGISYKCR